MNEIEQLREWIHDSDNIVFFVVRAYLPKAISRIFEVSTA